MPRITVMKCGRCPRTFESTQDALTVRLLIAKTDDLAVDEAHPGEAEGLEALRLHSGAGSDAIVRVVEFADLCDHCARAFTRFVDDYEKAYNKPKKRRAKKAKTPGPQLDAFAEQAQPA